MTQSHKNRLGNLDLLRLFAAILVLVYHFTYTGNVSGLNPVAFPELVSATQHLWAGVSLFFMISGFVIAYSAERGTAFDFLVSRAARLYPAFLVCMCATTLVLVLAAPLHMTALQITPAQWLANLTMVPIAFKQTFIDGVYWSIVTEITFYFWVWLLLAFGIFHRHQMRILLLWLAVSAVNELWLMNIVVNKIFATPYACYFTLGILMYRSFSGARRPTPAELILGLAALALTLVSDHKVHTWIAVNYANPLVWDSWRSLAKTLIFLALITLAIRAKPILKPAWCLLLGGLTYPLYLLHANIGYILFYYMAGSVNRWLLLAGISLFSLGLAYLVYRYVEPAGRALIYRLAGYYKASFAQGWRVAQPASR